MIVFVDAGEEERLQTLENVRHTGERFPHAIVAYNKKGKKRKFSKIKSYDVQYEVIKVTKVS